MLDKKNRITKQKEFDAFFGREFKQKKGRNTAGQLLIVKCFNNGIDNPRFGFIISNKIDKRATGRNKIKRQLREIIRLKLDKLKIKNDCLIIVKSAIKDKEYLVIEKELIYLLKQVGLL